MSADVVQQPLRYAVVTPARDEGAFIDDLIHDMVRQTVRPTRWIIVDDGSRDDTARRVASAAQTYAWITLITLPRNRERLPGPGVVDAFNRGLEQIDRRNIDCLVKLDADLRLPDDYFERLLAAFAARPALGIAGGACVENGRVVDVWPPYHVRGATKAYRVECFNDIGGLVPVVAWDGIDIVKAISHGWETATLREARFEHRRRAGSHAEAGGRIAGRFRQGRGNYVVRSLPFIPLLRAARIALRPPRLVGALALLAGYATGFFSSTPRLDDPEAIRVQHRLDVRKLFGRTDVSALAARQRRRRAGSTARSADPHSAV